MEIKKVRLEITVWAHDMGTFQETFESDEYLNKTDAQLINIIKKIYRNWNNDASPEEQRKLVGVKKVKVFTEESIML